MPMNYSHSFGSGQECLIEELVDSIGGFVASLTDHVNLGVKLFVNLEVCRDSLRQLSLATSFARFCRADALKLLVLLGLADRADAVPSSLTQVELRKLELAKAIATQPRLLIADEALAGLSPVEVDEILKLLFDLSGQGITIIMIEHIMRAVTTFSERILVLVAGEKIADGTVKEVMCDPKVEQAYLGQ